MGKETQNSTDIHIHTLTSNFYEDQGGRGDINEVLMMHDCSSWERNVAIAHFNLNTNEYSLKAVLRHENMDYKIIICVRVWEQICMHMYVNL